MDALIVGSAIVGFSIVVAAVIVIFGERRSPTTVGRYSLFQTGDRGYLLLDTRTGLLWERQADAPN